MTTKETTGFDCPLCNEPMRLRTGAFGEFWGCQKFPICRGTRTRDGKNTSKVETVAYAPILKVSGSREQEAIWAHLLTTGTNTVVNAGPGTGKTFTAIQYYLRAPKSETILSVAFNSHIAAEMNGKIRASKIANVDAKTLHQLGLGILASNFPSLGGKKADEDKMKKILEALSPMPAIDRANWRKSLNLAEKLASFVKSYLVDFEAPEFRAQLDSIADAHCVEISSREYENAAVLVAPALARCKELAKVSFDFDDMIWLPVVLQLAAPKTWNTVIVDEAQDLNPAQHELIFLVAGYGGRFEGRTSRIVVVGDRRQAIYAWRGAVANSIEIFEARLGATKRGVASFPLTLTRRCPKSHVDLARNVFPELVALDDAPEGVILELAKSIAIREMRAGDMVICRVNRDLIEAAYSLIERGIKPVVKGRDIGKGLIALVDQLAKIAPECAGKDEIEKNLNALSVWLETRISELLPLGDKAASRIQAVEDRAACVGLFLRKSKTTAEAKVRIETLFEANSENAVVLGTVHRTKGLEAHRVFVLAPELIPHPMAKPGTEEAAQESNICWIATTRAKFDKEKGEPGTLIFCGKTPPMLLGNQCLPLKKAC